LRARLRTGARGAGHARAPRPVVQHIPPEGKGNPGAWAGRSPHRTATCLEAGIHGWLALGPYAAGEDARVARKWWRRSSCAPGRRGVPPARP